MSSVVVERQGSQRPSRLHLPGRKVTSSGQECSDWAATAGLILDDWQTWVLEEALAERDDRRWSAFEVGLIVPRQNGKGSILEALELYHLFVLGTRLVVHSAHEFKTAREHFLRVKTLIQSTPHLNDQVKHIYDANGAEAVHLNNGCRLNFVARSKGSTRGFSGDLIVLDEAFNLSPSAMGAMFFTLGARPNPQVWYTSSAPHADSEVLHSVRARGLSGDGGALLFAEWGNDADVDWHDEHERLEADYRANPALGIRLNEEFCENEYNTLKDLGDEFPRERLGVPSEPDSSAGVFPPGKWQACEDLDSKLVGGARIGLQVGPGMQWASFATCGPNTDGFLHGELVERLDGTSKVVERAKYYADKYGPIIVNSTGPTSGVLRELEHAKVKIEEVSDSAMPKACARLQDKVVDGTFRHIGQAQLDAAVAGAAIRVSGDSWRWSQTNSRVDITPLVAVTLVLAATEGPKVPHFYA
jgi:hypothetical protein